MDADVSRACVVAGGLRAVAHRGRARARADRAGSQGEAVLPRIRRARLGSEDARNVGVLLPVAQGWRTIRGCAVSAVRALGEIGGPKAAESLRALTRRPGLDPRVQLEAVARSAR